MKKILLAIAATLVMTATLSATPCASGDVVIGVGAITDCTVGGLTFSNFTANGALPPEIQISGVFDLPGIAVLVFQFNPALISNDGLTLFYAVTGGGQTGFDVENQDGTIIETACSGAFTGVSGICDDPNTVLGQYVSVGPNSSGFIPFDGGAVVNVAWFKKDISMGATDALSDFGNSHHYGEIPEPATYGMIGAGLLALAAIRRRKA